MWWLFRNSPFVLLKKIQQHKNTKQNMNLEQGRGWAFWVNYCSCWMALALTWFWTYNLAINFNQSTTSPLIWDSHNAPLIVHHSKLSEHKLKNVILKIKCLQFIDLLEHFLFQWAWWDDNGKHKCMNPAVELRAVASVVKGGADYRGPWLWGVPLWFQPTASTEQLMNHCCTSSQKLIICMCFYALPI